MSVLSRGISVMLMEFRLHLAGSRYAKVISAFTPTLISDETVTFLFYEALRYLFQPVRRVDKIIAFGYFNTPVVTGVTRGCTEQENE